jgi:hypothetical protein
MADMQSGIGPFVGVFLQAHGWVTGLIGTVLTLGSVAGMAITTPIGGVIDTTNHKRALVVLPGIAVVVGSAIILLSQQFRAVAISQIATSVAGEASVLAVTGITLGIVKQRGFDGLGAGLQSVAVPGMVARSLDGTGRINLGQGPSSPSKAWAHRSVQRWAAGLRSGSDISGPFCCSAASD